MINVRLELGVKNIKKNAAKLMREGYSEQQAYELAYKYCRQQNARRLDRIHSSRKEQRLR